MSQPPLPFDSRPPLRRDPRSLVLMSLMVVWACTVPLGLALGAAPRARRPRSASPPA